MLSDFGPLARPSCAAEAEAQSRLALARGMREAARCQAAAPLDSLAYFPPRILSGSLDQILPEEIFAPVLQCCPYRSDSEDEIFSFLKSAGYGLTFGFQTRDPLRAESWARKARAGNLYLNRNMIGASVGSQPFGGEALSGTGPKIGGPAYMRAFCVERSSSNHIAAVGGSPGSFNGSEDFSLMRFFDFSQEA
jgi:RHH-type proline utilization regulon transcriptional repressor/proline dehydrogenase/delta 1-pyrroline-5-carboxylate dehydrogenase